MFSQKKYFVLTAVALMLLVIGFSSCSKSDSQISDKKTNGEVKEVRNVVDSSDIGPIYTCSMHPEVLQNYPGKCPKCKMELAKADDQSTKIEGTVYTCPMHQEAKANYEGTCPLCKMKLEKI